MTLGSLFAGIGGLDLGLERAGFTVRWQVENDPYCQAVLAKHWPNVTRYGDIYTIDWFTAERVDCVCGGFPCQPVSVAGRRLGTADPRWLWPEFARCIRVLRPRYVLVENVPGLLVQGMGDILGDLAACGYDAEWDSIPAAAVGAPHLRYRVFIVAYTTSINGARSIFPRDFRGEPEGAIGNSSSTPDWWATEPAVGRVAYGVSARVDRLKALGNAVVPQVAEWIGRRILEHVGD